VPDPMRQLAAIMFTDIVGYTGLMGKDESSAMEMIRKSREIQKPLVEKYGGSWVKEMGDGVMTRFNTALDAVKCAIDIQQMAGQKLGADLRIGIHLGDITIENNDIYGEGVNIASRLESIAEPGSIYLSDSIYNAIKGSAKIHFKYLGEKALKNVQDPVRTYRVVEEDNMQPSLQKWKIPGLSVKLKYIAPIAFVLLIIILGILQFGKGNFINRSDNPTITVLPINSERSDSTSRFLIEGLTNEIIRSLGKIGKISVINPITTMRYLGSVQPVADAHRDLQRVDYLLKGSFEKNGNRIDLSVELLNDREKTIWSESYSSDIARTPQMIGGMVADILEVIDIELSTDERTRIKDIADVNPEVYELFLKGMSHLNRFTPADFGQGLIYLKEAIDKNPADARAWAGLAEGYVYLGHSPNPPPDAWQMAKSAAIRAIQLDSTLAEAWAALAHTKTYFEWDYKGAEICYARANKLNPSLAMNHYHYAWHLFLFDRLDEAIIEHTRAQELDPYEPVNSAWLGSLYLEAGEYDKAFKEARRSMKIVKDFPLGYFILGTIYQKLGKYDSAIISYEKAAEIQPRFRYMGLSTAYFLSGQKDKCMEIINELKRSPLNSFNALMLAMNYAAIDSADQFFKYANYSPAHAWTPWLRVNIKNPLIIKDPRFKNLMDKMNLPMPVIPEKKIISSAIQ
jgi:adenylate cyclase